MFELCQKKYSVKSGSRLIAPQPAGTALKPLAELISYDSERSGDWTRHRRLRGAARRHR